MNNIKNTIHDNGQDRIDRMNREGRGFMYTRFSSSKKEARNVNMK